MTTGEFLKAATKTLEQAGVPSARLDTLIFLEDALETDRALLLAHPERPIPATKLATLNTKIARRVQHVPLAYIRGKAMFYGREFAVNEHVLTPRPETETIITMLRKLGLQQPRLADIGTGSGCIGITAALELPSAEVWLLDISQPALDVAQANAAHLGAHVHTQKANLLAGVPGQFDYLLANLPYVPDTSPINEAAQHEPKLALFAGADGLDLYRQLFAQLAAVPQRPPHILAESRPGQHAALAHIARTAGYAQWAASGYVQHFVA